MIRFALDASTPVPGCPEFCGLIAAAELVRSIEGECETERDKALARRIAKRIEAAAMAQLNASMPELDGVSLLRDEAIVVRMAAALRLLHDTALMEAWLRMKIYIEAGFLDAEFERLDGRALAYERKRRGME